MNCTCKKDIEAALTKRFIERSPEAAEHAVELQGYGMAIVGNSLRVLPYMYAEAKALFPLRKGGSKQKTVKQTMSFSFCPFCGESANGKDAEVSNG